ncbi:putative enoyl-CoA hydratase echA6 [Variovorax sp. PBL-H6]|uniref:enoyl-CoA hydratase/isomerase family protein n=1 Tax=Variovorax sp. PBL-H6 TaxID=434009 RepID=UPI001317588B|nr:enoyl-CoA hydratase/isomerase family protein [Variovorax sp. PBL-H6]VTU33460.1 putative enoyl-CoA hydratase echA6 [Variovorax sp. PBL-H6]
MSDAEVMLSWQAGVGTLTLNRPANANAVSASIVSGINNALDEAGARKARALVIEGAGHNFCAGFDLSGLDAETDDSLLARFVRVELMLQRVAEAPFLTVAKAQGRIMGVGADLFAACSLRLLDGMPTLAFPGFRGFGIVLGRERLKSLVDPGLAQRWLEQASAISAEEALNSGLAMALLDDHRHALTTAIELALENFTARRTNAAGDLDELVRSAAVPGLKSRIAAYIATTVALRRQAA